ncbi:MAG: phosphoenolpyruvate--protein phosphotransferase [Candidatus Dadabacteria bacterium]|nr:MAG: phosphoenolpyruvate--protein phosphotransferase [Candidatus Dadabacteria bacterium]
MRVELQGIAISPGIALGNVVLLDRTKMIVERIRVEDNVIEREKERFLGAVNRSKNQLLSIKENLDHGDTGEHLDILNFSIMMLEDELLSQEVLDFIGAEQVNAEWAINSVLTKKSETFKKVEDVYMKERLADFYYLGERILRNLHGVHDEISYLTAESVLIAHDLSAVDVVSYAKHHVIGIVTDIGAFTSHSAIVAKSLGIPTVMGLEDITARVTPGDTIFIDGFKGTVILNPDKNELKKFKKRRTDYIKLEKQLLKYAKLRGKTLDDVEISVNANIEIIEELDLARSYGAEGIGMYRTEFLFTNSVYFPDEDEQYENYQKVVSALDSPIVTIRTLDIGGDKFPVGMEPSKRLNPALGLRGIRFSLQEQDMFRKQIRAILRSSAENKIRILIPMISKLSEVLDTKKIIEEIAEELGTGNTWEIGVMIETPSAAIIASDISEEVDFLSIGTNDLIQYTLAVDRINEHVSYLYTPFHPAILRLIAGVVDAAHKNSIPVSVCGEMASQLSCVPLLVGMGVDELSMNIHSIPKVKKLLNTITEKDSKEILENALKLKTEFDIRTYVRKVIVQRWGDDFPAEFVEEIVTSV